MDTTQPTPLSLPRVEGWERGLGIQLDALRGARGGRGARLGRVPSSRLIMWEQLEAAATQLINDCSLQRTDAVDTHVPRMGGAWSISGMIEIRAALGDLYPDCADDLTPRDGASALRAPKGSTPRRGGPRLEQRRTELNQAVARVFDPASGVDYRDHCGEP